MHFRHCPLYLSVFIRPGDILIWNLILFLVITRLQQQQIFREVQRLSCIELEHSDQSISFIKSIVYHLPRVAL